MTDDQLKGPTLKNRPAQHSCQKFHPSVVFCIAVTRHCSRCEMLANEKADSAKNWQRQGKALKTHHNASGWSA
jgi:hypothetical protein